MPGVGVYRSDNGGANWVRVDNGTGGVNDITGVAGASRIELSVSAAAGNPVYAAVLTGNVLSNVFRSTDQGANWTALGAAPAIHPGSQGSVHFSILADNSDANVVYVGGDRANASPFVGNLFRGDASGGGSWTDITNAGGIGTAPHADSRDMEFDANGNIVEADDGGVYRFTNPTAAGTWSSVIGNLQATQLYGAAYDHLNNRIFGGTQDTGTTAQTVLGNTTWAEYNQGDGGTANVGYYSSGGNDFSVHYTMGNNFGTFQRRVYDSGNSLDSGPTQLTLTNLNATDTAFAGFSVFPYEVSRFDAARLVIGGNGLYESTDWGDTLTVLNPGGQTGVSAIAYGGMQGGLVNADVLYVGVNNRVYVRTTGGGALTQLAAYPGTGPQDIVMDPDDWQRVYVVDATSAYFSPDAGATWTTISGNLASLASNLQTVEIYSPTTTPGDEVLMVGGLGGVFRTLQPSDGASAVWTEFGQGMPNAVTSDLRYDATDDVLVAGTHGRGAWTVGSASLTLTGDPVLTVTGDDGPNVFRLVLNAGNPAFVDVFLDNITGTPDGSFELSTLTNIVLAGMGGNDTFTVDSSNGLIPVPVEIRGGEGRDSLTLSGGLAVSTTYNAGPTNDAGEIVTADAGTTQTVSFTGLEPVLDTVAAVTLTINATAADNAINYTTGALLTQGLITIDNFESFEFANKGALVINAGAGSDEIHLNNPNTPTALTTITVNGGDPTASDTLIVNGTAATTAVDTVLGTITGAGPVPITYTTVEHLTVNTGASTTLAVTGSATYAETPGTALDAGTVQTATLPIAFVGLGTGKTLSLTGTAGADTLVANGTDANDAITLAATTGNITLAGRATIAPTGIESLTLNGLDGDDSFTVTGAQPYTSILLAGGDPSASDVVNLTGDGANDLTVNTLGNANGVDPTVTGGGLGTVTLSGDEIVNLNAAGRPLTVTGNAGDDLIQVSQ
ncbi:MAG: hypothetical protein WCK05_11510, partial [Planctomycetota bacterium]